MGDMGALLTIVAAGDIACLESASEHSLANLLKLFLKCLPEPLFSWKLWPRFLAIPGTTGDLWCPLAAYRCLLCFSRPLSAC